MLHPLGKRWQTLGPLGPGGGQLKKAAEQGRGQPPGRGLDQAVARRTVFRDEPASRSGSPALVFALTPLGCVLCRVTGKPHPRVFACSPFCLPVTNHLVGLMKQDVKMMDETRGEKNILAIYIGIFGSLCFFIYLCTAIENRHPAMSSKQASMCTK